MVPIKKVRSSLIRKIILKVDADDSAQIEKLVQLKKLFEAHRGPTPVDFEVKAQSGENIETLRVFARGTPVDAADSTIEKLEEILGPDNVRISG